MVPVVILGAVYYYTEQKDKLPEVSFTEFKSLAESQAIDRILIDGDIVTIKTKNNERFRAVVPQGVLNFDELSNLGIEVKAKSTGATKYSLDIASLLFLAFLVYHYRKTGRNTAVEYEQDKKDLVSFSSIAGNEEVKEELKDIIDYLKRPESYHRMGANVPKGILLYGEPGTGKTLLAKAVAGEANVPFFYTSGAEFMEMFVGVGASRVRSMFAKARKKAPSIIFIDEIDAIGKSRSAKSTGGENEQYQTLNQLLVEMDGLSKKEMVIVMAATNRPEVLDKALLRAGRFDRRISVDVPDLKERKGILGVYSKDKPLAKDIDLEIIAKRTPGLTGADIANLFNDAALLAVRRNQEHITMQDLKDASERAYAGPERKSRVISPKDKELTAYHEAGHAVISMVLKKYIVEKVSIIPRGHAGGYTLSLPQNDKNYFNSQDLSDKITVLMGGRSAERLVLHDVSTGAAMDIKEATKIAKKMVTLYGMSSLGPISFVNDETVRFGVNTINSIDQNIRELITAAEERSFEILENNRDKLDLIAGLLIENETMERKEIERIFA